MKDYRKYLQESFEGYHKDIEKDFSPEEIKRINKLLFDIWPQQKDKSDQELLHKLMNFFALYM
jgi:hypothetical protein